MREGCLRSIAATGTRADSLGSLDGRTGRGSDRGAFVGAQTVDSAAHAGRPAGFAGHLGLPKRDATRTSSPVRRQKVHDRRRSRRLRAASRGTRGRTSAGRSAHGAVVHPAWWLDYGKTVVRTRRTSLIVDPPDGKIPGVDARGAANGSPPVEPRPKPTDPPTPTRIAACSNAA